jgi:hypothetical protein
VTYPAICDAIRLKHVIRLVYHGGTRDIEPYIYGRSSTGDELLRGYQLRGASRSGASAGWKMFRITDVSSASVTFEPFTAARAGYDPIDTVITFVNCRIEKK